MLKKLMAATGVLVIGVTAFFAAKALTDLFGDDPPSSPPNHPKIHGIAATPAPKPPPWPALEKPTNPQKNQTATDTENEGGSDEPDPVAGEPTEPEPAPAPPEPGPVPGSSGSTNGKPPGGSSGPEIEEEIGG